VPAQVFLEAQAVDLGEPRRGPIRLLQIPQLPQRLDDVLLLETRKPEPTLLLGQRERKPRRVQIGCLREGDTPRAEAGDLAPARRIERVQREPEEFHVVQRERVGLRDAARARFGIETIRERFPKRQHAAAGTPLRLEDRDVVSGFGEAPRRGEPGQAGAEDQNLLGPPRSRQRPGTQPREPRNRSVQRAGRERPAEKLASVDASCRAPQEHGLSRLRPPRICRSRTAACREGILPGEPVF